MPDEHRSTDQDQDGEPGTGPRHEADETSSSDAGLTGDEGVQGAQPAIGHDDDEPDDD